MEPEYRSILEQRRTLLVERVTWSKSFSEKLRKTNILPKAMLDEIERDTNTSNRTYVLLARMVTRPDQLIYQKFCDLLTYTGQGALADLLLQDRDNVVWDFDAGQRIKSLEDYFNAIHESLLLRMHDLEDGHIRAVITDETRRRVTRLSRFLLDEIKEHDLFRANVLQVSGVSEKDLKIDTVRSDLQQRPYLLFDDTLENTKKKNVAAMHFLHKHIESLEQENERLTDVITQTKNQLEATTKKNQELEKASEKKGDSAFLYLQKVIMDQDDNIAKLRNDLRSYEELVNLPRGDLIELLSSIRNTCPRASMLPMPHFSEHDDFLPPEKEVCPVDALRRHVKSIIDFTEQQKLRIVQNSTKIAELERERGTMKTLLNARGTTALPAVLSQQLKASREQKFDMSNTIKEFRLKLQEANRAKDQLEQRVAELNALLDPDAEYYDPQNVSRSNRSRRKSAKGRRGRRTSSIGPPLDRKGLITIRSPTNQGNDSMNGVQDSVNNNDLNKKNENTRRNLMLSAERRGSVTGDSYNMPEHMQQQQPSRQTLISQFINMANSTGESGSSGQKVGSQNSLHRSNGSLNSGLNKLS